MNATATAPAASVPTASASPYVPPGDCSELVQDLAFRARGGRVVVLSTDASNPLPITGRRLWRILLQVEAGDDELPDDLAAILPKSRELNATTA